MNPIIDPNIFWCAEIYGCLKIIVMVITISLLLGSIFYFVENAIDPLLVGVLILSAIIYAVIPSESTYYKMSIAKHLTPNNIELFENNTKELIDYITNAILNDKDTKK